jgi:hypothetical protein
MDYNKEYDDYKKEMYNVVEIAASYTERIVNGGGEEFRNELVDRLGSMHRTLQQKLIGEIVIPLIRNMAGRVKDHNYDDRNKLACEACAAMLNGLAEKFPYIANGSSSLPLI